jgi:hypothetical protein
MQKKTRFGSSWVEDEEAENFFITSIYGKVEIPGFCCENLSIFSLGAHGGKNKAFSAMQRAFRQRDKSTKRVGSPGGKLIERCMNAFTSSSGDVVPNL